MAKLWDEIIENNWEGEVSGKKGRRHKGSYLKSGRKSRENKSRELCTVSRGGIKGGKVGKVRENSGRGSEKKGKK